MKFVVLPFKIILAFTFIIVFAILMAIGTIGSEEAR